jgi:hypothetical protein
MPLRSTLRRYRAEGSDLSRPMEIDFFVAVPNKEAAESVAQHARSLGFKTNMEPTAAKGEWTCYCTKTLVPSFDNVRAIEHELDAIARTRGGQERQLSSGYRDAAAKLRMQWPEAAGVLDRLADNYAQDAEREDAEAQADRHRYKIPDPPAEPSKGEE